MEFPISEIKIKSNDYPRLLAQIYDPPQQLYCRGNIKLLNSFCFAVVGTRKITSYGREAAMHIVSGLAGSGMTIVSGLAMGIDAVAHKTALNYGLPTIAVMGSTVDDRGIAPRVNYALAKEILENGGLIISEYKTSKDIHRSNFAVRDRIISGLSKGVLVVEGAEKSGSLITAKSAADQGRDVFAIPGSIFSFVSAGTNKLLKDGAKLITSAGDILEEYGDNLELELSAGGVKNNISTKNPVEKKILDILSEMEEASADTIIQKAELEPSQAMTALSMLEINNKVRQRNGKYQKS